MATAAQYMEVKKTRNIDIGGVAASHNFGWNNTNLLFKGNNLLVIYFLCALTQKVIQIEWRKLVCN